jgi:hypothetical protein
LNKGASQLCSGSLQPLIPSPAFPSIGLFAGLVSRTLQSRALLVKHPEPSPTSTFMPLVIRSRTAPRTLPGVTHDKRARWR